jgi:peptide/nickel transport system substrate-binding protein
VRPHHRIVIVTVLAWLSFGTSGCTRVVDSNANATIAHHPWTQPQHLRIASTEEPDGLNPLFANSDAALQVESLIYAPILRYDDRGELIPELATVVPSIQNHGISTDGKTITLHFRPGVTWADGAPLDARDLRFTWRAVMNPRNNTRALDGWDDIAGIDLPDRLTAVIHLHRPLASILGIFALGGTGYPPLPEHVLGKLADLNHASFNAQPLASGPWTLSAWNHGAALEFSANPRYWRGAPKITHISYRIIPNADTLFAALRTHDVDLDESVQENQHSALATLEGITQRATLTANERYLGINTRKPHLRDVRVRRAIAVGVNWDRMNATVFHGTNERAYSDIPPTSWAAPTLAKRAYDPSLARTLLTQAGWLVGSDGIRQRNGERLTLTISSTNAKPANEQAEVQLQQELRAIGIALTIKNYPTSLLFAENGPIYGGTYDLSLTIDTMGPDPDNEAAWSSHAFPPNGANTSFLDDELVTQSAHLAAVALDRTTRAALYQREEARLYELVPSVPLYWQVQTVAYNSDLRNYKPAHYLTNFWNAWEWEL